MTRGKFITIEGGEGVGKTTQMDFICHWIESQGIEVVATREPGGTPLGERIREILLDPSNDSLARETELLLMFAARSDHWSRKILPAINKGIWVISDRFTDASYAYQGGGRKIPRERIAELERLVLGEQRPDLTLLLDVPVTIATQRVHSRGDKDRIEQEQDAFFTRVRDAYLEIALRDKDRIRVIDASQSVSQVQAQVLMCLQAFMETLL